MSLITLFMQNDLQKVIVKSIEELAPQEKEVVHKELLMIGNFLADWVENKLDINHKD